MLKTSRFRNQLSPHVHESYNLEEVELTGGKGYHTTLEQGRKTRVERLNLLQRGAEFVRHFRG